MTIQMGGLFMELLGLSELNFKRNFLRKATFVFSDLGFVENR